MRGHYVDAVVRIMNDTLARRHTLAGGLIYVIPNNLTKVHAAGGVPFHDVPRSVLPPDAIDAWRQRMIPLR
jgi:hypothetical protein